MDKEEDFGTRVMKAALSIVHRLQAISNYITVMGLRIIAILLLLAIFLLEFQQTIHTVKDWVAK